MNSLDEQCTPLKSSYDECFNKWFKVSFLKSGSSDHDTACGQLFIAYQECVKKALEKKALNLPEIYEDVLGSLKEEVPPK